MNILELREKVKRLPLTSGVYIMRNNKGDIIYIGKAKKLRNRVKQYFDGGKKQIKVQAMVNNICDFDYILTKNDVDAFLLENNLIKQHKPKYNILLKDDKQYPYIKINMKEKFPQVQVTRRIMDDEAMYFGPYVNMGVNNLIEIIRSAFKIRTCKKKFDNFKPLSRPCLHGEIGNCLAPCVNRVTEEQYLEAINSVIDFLRGNTKDAQARIEAKMNDCAKNEDFENAISLRDKMYMIEKLGERHIASLTKAESFDVFAVRTYLDYAIVNVMNIRCGKNIGQLNYVLENYDNECETLETFIFSYYKNASLIQKSILVNVDCVEELHTLFAEAYDKSIDFMYPKKGAKLEIIKMCEQNAEEYARRLATRSEHKDNMTVGALKELESILGIEFINRIEGYDISNIQGAYNVSSMVVFEGGEAVKKEYRKFKIKTFEGADDFAAMAETLTRRFERYNAGDEKFGSLPDLILIDGGLGQLHSANSVLEKMGLVIPIISIAKKEEEIYTLRSSEPIRLEKRSFALRLLQRVRDESHRFAITFHRQTRNKEFLSDFETIEGVGAKTRQKILATYKSVDDLYNANVVELCRSAGIGVAVAEKIYNYLHKNAK